ncbi:MAG: hypothetical protein ACI8U3_001483 [Brevundimonas sp.]|jgi:hypothetical protein|uniref:DUF6491 family protein n=1 Tax=Brevundimonas sp. TaxID=1871086 RepID=UPI0039E65393
MRIVTLFIALAAASFAGCAPMPSAAPGADGEAEARRCFLVSQVRNFSAADAGTIVVHASRRSAFELAAVGYCRDIDWANQVAIQPLVGASNLCVDDLADLVVRPLGGDIERCRVRVTRSLTEAEIEAL